ELSRTAHEAGLRILIDIVPNHQAATGENRRWQEALESRTPGWFDVRWVGDQPRYRRFFDVDGLVGVRVEDEVVFRETHALVFELLEHGVVDGLRVDHVDGLADPGQYLERLDRATGGAFTVVEKILARDETLPGWPVAGTTGYEAGNALTSLAIDPEGREQLEGALLAENGGVPFAQVECESKAFVLDRLFRPEWKRLRELLGTDALLPALRADTLGLDVYRVYDDSPEAEKRLARASAGLDPQAAEAVRARLLGNPRSELSTRWQQLTGPVMAKGHEDTSCYRYPALLAQNEVGGDPASSAHDSIDRFQQLADGYRGLIGTSTHDSKRSEDVRARLCVLSERPAAFAMGLDRWRELVEPAPDVTAVESRFVAQTLLGAWPLTNDELPTFQPRMAGYLTKALREAKEKSNWLAPDVEHERRVIELADRTIADGGGLLHEAFGRLVDEVMFFGALNSLAMLTWKLAMPGTPDIYRGCELWDLSLVDPDNRRPVDFAARARVLEELDGAEPVGEDELLRDWRSGAIKMHVTASGLRARRAYPELFGRGELVPVAGPKSVLAFARHLDGAWAVAIAPRLATRVTTVGRWPLGAGAWGDSTLVLPDPARTEIRLADALSEFPVALVVVP
ncbi:MAG: (1-_4)-alpha-D-glucan 1-alpha-D-glucosylmutase, partial [Actinomycetota bacterium]|nr:(1->4)-alpha-D-glucan 1-alpha-D-glucosylmutase [Actinomycetota bacterium]